MIESSDALLKELQREFLKDPENYLEAIRKTLVDFSASPSTKLKELLRIIHSLKGNVQAVGFQNFSGFIHDLENAVQEVQKKIDVPVKPSEGDHRALEFLVTDAFQSLEHYFNDLRLDLSDSEEKRKQRGFPVQLVASWRSEDKVVEQKPAEVRVVESPVSEAVEPPASHLYLICREKGVFYAVPIEQVLEVVESQRLNPLPYPRSDIIGLVNFRGEPLPIVNCSHFEKELSVLRKKGNIVIATTGGKIFGFGVEIVEGVGKLDPAQFQKPEGLNLEKGDNWITHLVRDNQRTVLVMDLRRSPIL